MNTNIKLILFSLVLVFSSIMAQAGDSYLPLVREGVKWVYYDDWEFYSYDGHSEPTLDSTVVRNYYIEFRGDTVIGGRSYKKAFRTADVNLNHWGWITYSGSIPIGFARDTTIYGNHYVYAIRNVNVTGPMINEDAWWEFYGDYWNFENYCQGEEYLLYYFYADENLEPAGDVTVSGHQCAAYDWRGIHFVEGIGIDGNGDLLSPFGTCMTDTEVIGCAGSLRHVEDADGNVIYKGQHYDNGGCEAADFDRSGAVDIDDLNACISRLLAPPSPDVRHDVTGDGRVDIDDVNAIISTMLKR